MANFTRQTGEFAPICFNRRPGNVTNDNRCRIQGFIEFVLTIQLCRKLEPIMVDLRFPQENDRDDYEFTGQTSDQRKRAT